MCLIFTHATRPLWRGVKIVVAVGHSQAALQHVKDEWFESSNPWFTHTPKMWSALAVRPSTSIFKVAPR